MKKVVLNTNVIIAAFTARGLASSVFELCLERFEIIIYLNNVIFKQARQSYIPRHPKGTTITPSSRL